MRVITSRGSAVIVVVATCYWWAIFLAMHVLEPEFNPITAPGSAYVLGAYGAWMTSTYFVLSAAMLGVAYGLMLILPATGLSRPALSVFVVAAAGAVLAGLFPMEFPGPPRTLTGRLHVLGGMLTFPPWVLGVLLVSLFVRRDPRWTRSTRLLLMLSTASIGMFVVLICSQRILGFAGYAQRLLLALLFAWLLVVARHLIRVSHETYRQQ